MRTSVTLAFAFATLSVGGMMPSLTQAAEGGSAVAAKPDGELNLTGGSIAAGIGYTWGSGQLKFGGEAHRVKISGLSIVDVGAAKIAAHGSVYHLTQLSDFNGTYTTFSAGAAIAGGGGVAYLRNEKGVVIRLDSTNEGLRFHLSTSGVTLKVAS